MRGKKNFLAGLAAISSVVIGLLYPSSAFAFSAYGAGTSGNPYRIATCAQLHEIDNDLAGYYVLVANINCSGSTFAHLAGSGIFTGTLDGQNHTISNLNVDNYGLFAQTSGATIKNIAIDSGSVTGTTIASFVWDANYTTLTNVHSAMSVTSTSSYAGGLVGQFTGTSSISQSSFTGILSGQTYTGGLVGAIWDAGGTISDSFSSGTLSSHSAYEGGIVGGLFNGDVARVYSSMTIDTNGNPYNGGLIGDSQVSVSNSFSAVTSTGGGSNYGGVVGLNIGGPYTNIYFDQTTNGTSSCYGLNSAGGCTSVNAGNATPDYFKNNSTSAPLDTWDFDTVWATTSGYPTLKNISGFAAPTTPNGGDANGDGIDDSYQANILSVQASNGKWTTVTLPSASGCTLGNGQSSQNTDTLYNPYSSLTGFYAYCPNAGDSVTVSIIYDQVYSNPVLRYYNPNTGQYSTVLGGVFSTVTIGGVAKTMASYSVTDGGEFDSDGAANGLIQDPVGIAQGIGVPNTGVGPRDESLVGILIPVTVGLLAVVTKYTLRRNKLYS